MNDEVQIQPKKLVTGAGVPMFLLRIYSDLKYEAFHCGVKINIQSLTCNKNSHLSRWSQIEEALGELNLRELSNKQNVNNQQIQATGSQTIGQVKYSLNVIIRATFFGITSYYLLPKLCINLLI